MSCFCPLTYQNLPFCRVPINSIFGFIIRTYKKVGFIIRTYKKVGIGGLRSGPGGGDFGVEGAAGFGAPKP